MADKTDDLVISISTDLATVRRQLKQLEGLIANAGNNAGRSFAAAGKKMDAALSPVQERINKLTGVGGKGTKEWTGALASQGKELDRLRKKYNPLFAAQQSYLANLRDIKQAHAIGAISAQEMGAAITREKAAFAGNVAVINGTRGALGRVGGAAKLTSNQMLNLSRQGNDVITMFALGANPMQIFASQAGQIYDALEQGPGGIKGSLRAIGASIAGLVTPAGLAVTAISAVGAAFVAYKVMSAEGTESLDDILKEHAEHIKLLGDAYDDVIKKQRQYAVESANTFNLLNEGTVRKMEEKLKASISNIVKAASTSVLTSVGGALASEEVIKAQFAPFAKAIRELEQSAGDAASIKRFRENITAMADASPELREAASALLGLSDGAWKVAQSLPQVSQKLTEADEAFAKLQAAIQNVKSDSVRDELEKLRDKAKDGDISIGEVIAALNSLENTNLNLAGPISALKDLFDAAMKARKAVAGTQVLPQLGTVGPVYSAGGEFIDEGQLQTVRANATKSQFQLAQEKAAKAGRKKGKTDAEKQADAIKRVTDSLKFEIEQLGRSDREQEIYNKLRSAGVEINTKAGRTISELAGKHYDLVEAQNAAKKAQDDFNEGLEQLESDAIDALGNVIAGTEDAADAFKKLAIEIVKSALTGKGAYSDFFASLTGGKLGGGGSILGALFGGLLGGGSNTSYGAGVTGDPWAGLRMAKGGIVAHSQLQPISTFASGGVSNKPAIFGEAGPEAAVPLPDGRRIPVDLRMPSIAGRQTSPSATAQVIDINVNVSGARGNTEISQMVERGVRLGIDEFSRRGLPVRVQQIGNDPRARG